MSTMSKGLLMVTVVFAAELVILGSLVLSSTGNADQIRNETPALAVSEATLVTFDEGDAALEIVTADSDAVLEEVADVDDSASSYDDSAIINANVDGNWISASDFRFSGVHRDSSGYSYTYYSENVLPGGGLNIPGRHVGDEGYVMDGDNNLCVASSDLPYGTVVKVPFGTGTAVVYDSGCSSGVLDVYVSW